MTAKRRLVPLSEIRETIETLRELGVLIGAVDVRADGVTVYPPGQLKPENDVGRWFEKDAHRDQAARRQ